MPTSSTTLSSEGLQIDHDVAVLRRPSVLEGIEHCQVRQLLSHLWTWEMPLCKIICDARSTLVAQMAEHLTLRRALATLQESEPVQPPSVQGWRAGVKWTEFYVSDRDACSAWTPHSPLKLVPAFDNVVHYTLIR